MTNLKSRIRKLLEEKMVLYLFNPDCIDDERKPKVDKKAVEELVERIMDEVEREITTELVSGILGCTSLWSVWCNHYPTKKKYDKNMKKDLEFYGKHIAERIRKAIKGEENDN